MENGGGTGVANQTQVDTVYIVEDDDSTREALGELIRPTGARVEAFRSAEDFLKSYEPRNPSCLLLDQRLPGISGCELLRQLRSEGVPVPAVFVTAYATTPMTVDAMRMGAVNVLDKPCCENELRDAIGLALSEHRKQLRRSANRREAATRLDQLTPSERDVLTRVLDGVPNKQIARELNVCIRTVEARRSRIYKTMGVQSVAELTRACVAAGFVDA
ncbi:response regulator [Aeoliella sp. ICT_H6.2]|uniref:Response regulator n=2 Tax=Aeoliella straminimaris TaxID=2954799 RepID=A0A9X2JHR3_9BACT|nr:response regulator [Aeoliella straminimaris]